MLLASGGRSIEALASASVLPFLGKRSLTAEVQCDLSCLLREKLTPCWEAGVCCTQHSSWCLVCLRVCVLSCVQLFATPWTVACQASPSMELSRQEHWSGLPFPTPGDLFDPGIKPVSLVSPALAGGFFTTAVPGKPPLPPPANVPWGPTLPLVENLC